MLLALVTDLDAVRLPVIRLLVVVGCDTNAHACVQSQERTETQRHVDAHTVDSRKVKVENRLYASVVLGQTQQHA